MLSRIIFETMSKDTKKEPGFELQYATMKGHLHKRKSLLDTGKNEMREPGFELQYATMKGHLHKRKSLLDTGKNEMRSELVPKKMRFSPGHALLKPKTCEEVDMVPLPQEALKDKGVTDFTKFMEAVRFGSAADINEFEVFFRNRKYENFPVDPLLIVATFGSSETVEYLDKWSSFTFDWNRPLEIQAGVFNCILDKIKDGKATPLYVATFFENLVTTKSLIKYSDEKDIVACMNNLPLSNHMEQIYMAELGERLKIEYYHLKPAVVPGHQKKANGTSTRVFIIYSPEVISATNQIKEGIGMVMLRNPYKVDSEAMTVSDNKDAHCEISKQDMDKAKLAIELNSKQLWCEHSNLNIISVCSVQSKRKAAELKKGLCVVLYCSTKGVVPVGEAEFPRQLTWDNNKSIAIDVREGYFEYGGYKTRPSMFPHKKLKMGCNIGVITPHASNCGGTLGPFVEYNGAMSFLTCAHVLFDVAQQHKVDFDIDIDNEVNRRCVAQPAPGASFPTGAPCGFVQRAIFDPNRCPSIDVAVVTISDAKRKPTKGRFANDHSYRYKDEGFDELPEYNSGSTLCDIQHFGGSNMVVKFGSETHLTKGSLKVHGSQVRPLSTVLGVPLSQDIIHVSGQYEVEGRKSVYHIFQPGDSGSAVFMLDRKSLHCIGMAIGHTSYGNAVVTPIGALINALGTQHCRLATFEG